MMHNLFDHQYYCTCSSLIKFHQVILPKEISSSVEGTMLVENGGADHMSVAHGRDSGSSAIAGRRGLL